MQRRKFLSTAGKSFAATALLPHASRMLSNGAPAEADKLVLYPDPPIPRASEFKVTVNGKPLYVYNAGTFRGVSFSFAGRVTIEITYSGKIHSHSINPTSKAITAVKKDNTLTFTLTRPQKLEIQINDATAHVVDNDKLLYLFADAIETDIPSPTDPDLYYFGPGRHTIVGNVFEVKADDHHKGIYLAPGAVLEAVISVSRKSNFKIYGRGFLRNPFTDKSRNMLQLSNCIDCSIRDIHLFDSIQHVMVFNAHSAEDGHDISVTNVKSLHYIVNSDGVTFSGAVSGVVVEDCFIIGNDNLIVIGGGAGSDPIGPANNIIRNTTFLKSSYAGNWCFLQGSSPPKTGGSIGPGHLFADCDLIRMNGELGLITEWWGTPNTIDNVIFDNIRLQSFAGYVPKPEKTNVNMLLNLQSTDAIHKKEITLRNMHLRSTQTSQIAAGNWVIHFEHVTVAGKPVKSDADLKLSKGTGVVTTYIS